MGFIEAQKQSHYRSSTLRLLSRRRLAMTAQTLCIQILESQRPHAKVTVGEARVSKWARVQICDQKGLERLNVEV